MKRLLAAAAILALILTLASCTARAPDAPPLGEPTLAPSPTPEPPPEGDPDPPPEPEPEPEPEPDPDYEELIGERVEEILGSMTLRERICQLFIVTPEGLTGVRRATVAEELTEAALKEYPVGGLVYFSQNIVSAKQLRSMIDGAQNYSKLGLFIAVDEEGGRVSRLMGKLGTTRVGAMYGYRGEGEGRARENAAVIGADIASFGFNLDFAPVADIWTNPANTVIGDRAYSGEPEEAGRLVAAAVEGFHSAGVMCTLKHFPGHGDTEEDSHTGAAYVFRTRGELEGREWVPFRAGIEAGADMVMVGHLIVPDISDEPATLSEILMTDILRGELGFDGVIVTDSLSMRAVTDLYEPGELCVRALEAGADILLMPEDLASSVAAIEKAVASGRLTEARLEESLRRILTLKLRYGVAE